MTRKVFVVGLDCATPQLLFDQWRDDLPNLDALMRRGGWGELESCVPPITVPAWTVMTSSRDPGQLGIYGFRNRADYSYERMYTVTNKAVKADRVWDILSRAGKRVVVVGVPPSYPPYPVNGAMVGCFLTPGVEGTFTYPPELGKEIVEHVGGYAVDVADFRTDDKAYLLRQIHEMTELHFRTIHHLMTTREWDFFMSVEIGTDRIHHGFWKYMDPAHRQHPPGNPYRDAIRDYYRVVDRWIGVLLKELDDDTVVFVVSDHGAKRMDGGICLNEWLIQNDYLVLKSYPERQTPLERCDVDWDRTVAWGAGGYYGRLMLNVRGREPRGVVPPERYEAVRDELAAKLSAIADPDGRDIGTRVYRPEELYREVNGIPPDLIILFGGLYWRSVGSVGSGQVHTFENDTGPDDANHAERGIFVMHDPRAPIGGRRLEGLQLMDFAPTVLDLFGITPAADMRGRIVRVPGPVTA